MNEVIGRRPDNYLAWAIVTLILCCWPFSIIAIVNSVKVDRLWDHGEYDEALRCSDEAKKWVIISAILGIFITVMTIVLAIIAGRLIEEGWL